MDRDYAVLSMRIGLFAARADAHLGRPHFVPLSRTRAFSFTPADYQRWRREARQMGIPADIIAFSRADSALVASLVDAGLAAQERADRRSLN